MRKRIFYCIAALQALALVRARLSTNHEQQQQQQRFQHHAHLPRATQASSCVSNSLHILPTVSHRPQKLVIANRGASYHMPEHTIPAYRLALEMGADFIQTGLVATKDEKLIALHSIDLNATTNLLEVFPDREPWKSPSTGKTGYWSYNFTYDEISQLRVKQRWPDGRTTSFDSLFSVPSLEEVVKLVVEWNHNEIPNRIAHTEEVQSPEEIILDVDRQVLRHPSPLELAESGIYLELKDVATLQKDADIDLVNVLMDHIAAHSFEWNWILPCYQEILYDTYRVPGLVIQSFEGDALQRFHKKWIERNDATEIPEPPYVLLTDLETCEDEMFWNKVDAYYRSFLGAIAPDKACVITQASVEEGAVTMTVQKARDFNLAIHPWTERPEKNFLVGEMSRFNSAFDETQYLLCEVGVEGIFTDAVASAVSAAKMGCDRKFTDPAYPRSQTLSDGVGKNTPPFCVNSDREMAVYLSIIFFVIGCLSATVICSLQRVRERKEKEGMFISESERPPLIQRDAFEQPSMDFTVSTSRTKKSAKSQSLKASGSSSSNSKKSNTGKTATQTSGKSAQSKSGPPSVKKSPKKKPPS